MMGWVNLPLLIAVGRINENQQLRLNLLDGQTVFVLIEIRQFLANLPTDCLQISKGCHEQATKPGEADRWPG